MEKQNYKNHLRWYAPHHFAFYPVLTTLLSLAIYFFITHRAKLIWLFLIVIIILFLWLSYMLRQHYALTLQNRLVKLEMNFRYYVLTQQRLELLSLTDPQIFALRFASDAELPALVQRALNEKLSAADIKKSIADWQADHQRV
jgi:ABC-type transport system involved in cytochrome bd biosynthesis fused ATPase/permease subunit